MIDPWQVCGGLVSLSFVVAMVEMGVIWLTRGSRAGETQDAV
jgi:hypothetical protein